MNNIKVSVSYEKPSTTKFDALMAEYKVAKKMADETVSYYKPLADAAENAKFNAIMEQLETIKSYAMQIGKITKTITHLYAPVCGYQRKGNGRGQYFSVAYRPNQTTYTFEIMWGNNPFDQSDAELLAKWEEWEMYQKLEKDAHDKLQNIINNQASRAQRQIDRLNNIQGD